MSIIIQKMPTARHIQPMGFLGRLEAIRAPTTGNARKGNNKMSTALSPPVPQELGGCTDRVAMYSTTDAAAMATERLASDHASHAAVRALIPPTPCFCSLGPAVTTPLYSTHRLSNVTTNVTRLNYRRGEVRKTAGSRWLSVLRGRSDVLGAATGHVAARVEAGVGGTPGHPPGDALAPHLHGRVDRYVGSRPSAALGLVIGGTRFSAE